jgi:hypothetical protein
VTTPSHGTGAVQGRRADRLVPTILWVASVAGAAVLGGFHLTLLIANADSADPSIASVSLVLVFYASLGWLILRRRSGHRVGWLFLATALVLVIVFSGWTYGPALAASRGRDDLIAGLLVWLGIVLYVPAILLALPLLGILFPDGHLPGPRWRLPVGLVVVGAITASLCFGLTSGAFAEAAAANPFAMASLPSAVTAVGAVLAPVVILGGGLLGIAAMVVRFRRGRPDERQQIKWMLAALVAVVALDAPIELGLGSDLLGIGASLGFALIPGATTLAILRYRLYDIDRLISRTLAYALVTGALVVLAVGGNLAVQTVLADLTQANTIAVAVSTLLMLSLAQPLLRRTQRLVDRRFDRTRIDAERTVAAFAERQRDQVDLDALVEDMRGTASASVRPASVDVWLTSAGRALDR